MCSQGSGEQSKYCWSKDDRTRAASLWGENQAGGSESWNFKISHPEGVKLLIQGPADSSYVYTCCRTDWPGKGGVAPHWEVSRSHAFSPACVPRSAPGEASGIGTSLAAPST